LRVAPPNPATPKKGTGAYGPSGAIALFLRESGEWLVAPSLSDEDRPASEWEGLSPLARKLAAFFAARGAAFLTELLPLARESGVVPAEAARRIDEALWELVRHGVVASDGFDGLRTLLARRRGVQKTRSVGRWSLIHRDARPRGEEDGALRDGSPTEHAWLYLRRYGIITRDLLARESLAPTWRELVEVYRRLEARGEIRGGRFVTGMRGEHFALPESLDRLRTLPRCPTEAEPPAERIELSAADPLNLVGILTIGRRESPLSTAWITLIDGVPSVAAAPDARDRDHFPAALPT
jgi:ATP-dependent Lhr-like helicase